MICSNTFAWIKRENIFRGMVFEPHTNLIYKDHCAMNPIGKNVNGKIKS